MPTTTSIEIVKSQELSISNGTMIGVREWRVWNTDGTPLSPADALSDAGIPPQDNDFPGIPILRVNELITTERISGNPNMIKVVWDYIAQQQGNFPDPFIIEYNVEVIAELIEVYRTSSSSFPLVIPTVAEFDNTSTADIGGVPNDIRGTRKSYLRHQMLIQISERRGTAAVFEALGIRHLRDPTDGYFFLDQFVGTRNSTLFLGFPRGTLLYTGLSSHTLTRLNISLTHHFVADEWSHFVQICEVDKDGDCLTAIVANGPKDFNEQEIPVAFPVYWRQPFPRETNFHLISPSFP